MLAAGKVSILDPSANQGDLSGCLLLTQQLSTVPQSGRQEGSAHPALLSDCPATLGWPTASFQTAELLSDILVSPDRNQPDGFANFIPLC